MKANQENRRNADDETQDNNSAIASPQALQVPIEQDVETEIVAVEAVESNEEQPEGAERRSKRKTGQRQNYLDIIRPPQKVIKKDIKKEQAVIKQAPFHNGKVDFTLRLPSGWQLNCQLLPPTRDNTMM